MDKMKKSKSMDKMPARKMPEGFEFPKNKKAVPNPPSNAKFRTATKKTTGVRPTKEAVKKVKALTGPAAVEALQKRVSPSGVKKAETGAKKAIDKKYPGLYKKKSK